MLREARQEDYPLLLDIQTACISGLTDTYSIKEIQAWSDYIAEEGEGRYGQYENRVFEDENGRVAGFVSWSQNQSVNKNVECLYVLPRFRNQGIGRLLLWEAEANFTSGATVSVRSTLNAVPFYERQGYERIGNAISRAGFHIAILEKTLS